MRNFLNQTWIVALIAALALGGVCYLIIKKSNTEPETKEPASAEKKKKKNTFLLKQKLH